MTTPTPDNLPFAIQTKSDALARIYLDLDMHLRTLLVNATREQINGSWQGRRAATLLEQVRAQLEKVHAQTLQWEVENVPYFYKEQQALIEQALKEAGKLIPPDGAHSTMQWHRLNAESIDAIAADMAKQRAIYFGIRNAANGQLYQGSILRQADDYLRKISTIHIARGAGIGTSAEEVGRRLRTSAEETLRNNMQLQELGENIDRAVGVVDSTGKVWSLQRYSQMAARTGIGRAMGEASAQKLAQWGEHVYQVSSHGSLCYLCAPFEGKVFAIDAEGVRMGYPLLRQMPPFHPNCLHSLVPYIVEALPRGEKGPTASADILSMNNQELYQHMKETHPERLQASRQGFNKWNEYQRYKNTVGKKYGLANSELRGPRYRYADIESRRKSATVAMLGDNNLTYAGAMAKQTTRYMGTPEYARLRPSITPARQRREANSI